MSILEKENFLRNFIRISRFPIILYSCPFSRKIEDRLSNPEVGVTRVIHSIPNSTPCSLLSLFSSIFPLASTFFEHVDREIREGFVDRKTDEKSNKITKKE